MRVFLCAIRKTRAKQRCREGEGRLLQMLQVVTNAARPGGSADHSAIAGGRPFAPGGGWFFAAL